MLLAVAARAGDRAMSSATQVPVRPVSLRDLPVEEHRGRYAMWGLIATEAALFVCLFGAYFYLGNDKARWSTNQPPKVHYALIMLAVLLTSSAVLHWGEKQVKRGLYASGRRALLITILIGFVFLALQAFEYLDHWKTLTPYSNSYGSIFYTITTFHAAHLIVGLLILIYVLFIPRYGPTLESPFRPYETASLYWHFVDFVWIFIVLILYVIPNLMVHG
jgi:heme/copper-type cytochrome/quinol oxidase subunit 3